MVQVISLVGAWRRKVQLRQHVHRYWVAHPAPDPALLHHSDFFATLRRKFGLPMASQMGQALSNAGLSFLGGSPRNPNLKVGQGPDYSTIRQAESLYAYTVVTKERHYCPRCGRDTLERHIMELHDDVGGKQTVGYVESCNYCDSEHWLFKSHMPRAVAGRKRDRKVVP